jgi:hypothetical protein
MTHPSFGDQSDGTWKTHDAPVPAVTLESVQVDGDDYSLMIRRPDGSVVCVLIPREGTELYEDSVVRSSERPFGLNLVCSGHYC